MKKQRKGITLVALVITIIILLILAGITINLTVGQRGILNMAKEAGRNYQEATRREDEELKILLDESENILTGTIHSGDDAQTPITPSGDKYTIVDGVPVPKGFIHVEGTKNDGFVIKDISVDGDGNPTSTNGNEFVWVPCSDDGSGGSTKYDRYIPSRAYSDGGIDAETNSVKIVHFSSDLCYYVEAMPCIQGTKTELDSIKQYGGFYIGRYEVGVVGYDTEVKTSNTSKEAEWTGYNNGKAIVQKDKQVWNYITRDKAKKVAEEMYNNEVIISRLCSSYAWDTTLQFIEIRNEGFSDNR